MIEIDTLGQLELICKRYINKEFELEEFQSRLETLIISDEKKAEIEKVRLDAVNRLEKIRFCNLEANFYKYGVVVATSLVELVRRMR